MSKVYVITEEEFWGETDSPSAAYTSLPLAMSKYPEMGFKEQAGRVWYSTKSGGGWIIITEVELYDV